MKQRPSPLLLPSQKQIVLPRRMCKFTLSPCYGSRKWAATFVPQKQHLSLSLIPQIDVSSALTLTEKQCKAHNYCWRRWDCCLGKEGRSFLTSSKQPPTTCSHCTRTKLCYSDRMSMTFMPFYLYWYEMCTRERSILSEKHSGWNYTVLRSSRICECNGLEESISLFLNWIYLCYSSSLQNMCNFAFSPLNQQPGHKAKAFIPCAKASKRGNVWGHTECFTPLLNTISFFLLSWVTGIFFSCINLYSNVTRTVAFISKTSNRN